MEKLDNINSTEFREMEEELENIALKASNTRRNIDLSFKSNLNSFNWNNLDGFVKKEISRVNYKDNPFIAELLLEAYNRMFMKYWMEADRGYVLVKISTSLHDLIDIGIVPKGENKKIFQRKLDKEIDRWMCEFIHNGGLGMTLENNEK